MINCPHSIYFFRNSVDDFGLLDEFKGDKTKNELTMSPNPLLNLEDVYDYYRSTESFITNNLYINPGIRIKKGDYIKVVSTYDDHDNRIAKFDTMGDNIINTFRDWNLVPLGRPIVAPPEQKTHFIEIPGANGIVDVSNILTKYPIFNNRTGSWVFALLGSELDTPTSYDKIVNFLHGNNVKVVLEDDMDYFYQGRVFIENVNPKSDGTATEFTLGYDLDPYKRTVSTSLGDWNWDKFNFDTDISNRNPVFSNIEIPPSNKTPDSQGYYEFDFTGYVGPMPVVPDFILDMDSNAKVYAKLYNSDLDIYWKEFTLYFPYAIAGGLRTNRFNDCIFCEVTKESVIKMKFKYSGPANKKARISIRFRSGRL